MVRSLTFCRLFLVAFYALLTLVPVALAAEDRLTADVEVLYPFVGAQPRGGGVAAIGTTQFEYIPSEKSPDGKTLLRMSGTRAPLQAAWWFPGHLPMKPDQALIGDADARLIFEFDSVQPVRTELSTCWRVEGDQADWLKSAPLQVVPGRLTHVEFPIPDLKPGARITGILMSFSAPGDYRIRRIAIGRKSSTLIDEIDPIALRNALEVKITGRAAAGINQVTVHFVPKSGGVIKTYDTSAEVKNGRFEVIVTQQELDAGGAYGVTAEAKDQPGTVSPAQRLFVYPALTGKTCPPVTRNGTFLMREGKPFGFVGVNYTRFDLGLSVQADYELLAHDLVEMKSFGVRVVRVPMDFAFIQPDFGVTADDPRYKDLMIQHNLDPRFVEQLDYFVKAAGELGIYTIIDWHGMALDPYRYFLGGREQERKSGQPGKGISYLAKSPTEAGDFYPEDPRHLEALLTAHRWAAKHFRGNSNILAIEIPYNEPHTTFMAVEANWRRIVDLSAKAVAEGDPDRMTFILAPSYSHNNLLPSVTWMIPDRATGGSPHFYQANGPIPVRADAAKMREPWLARESEGTFGWSFPAVMMPFTAVPYPFYNGETGAHGASMVLPDRSPAEAASLLIEAQLVQEYAAGMAGRIEWTLWGDENDFVPYIPAYRTMFNRFAPVFEAGPLDRMRADVLFIQNPEASPSSNGHNFACIPFAKASLDLHLPFVHYMTDAQFRFSSSAEISVGLEQVVHGAENLKYKAIVADRRFLDPRVTALLKGATVPVLWVDRAEDLTTQRLAAFLEKSGMSFDSKSPREMQIIEGTGHLVVYRRLAGGSAATRIYPQLQRTGDFELINEAGIYVFKGNAATLMKDGLQVDLPVWRSAIFKIVTE